MAHHHSVIVGPEQPLIGIPREQDGQHVVEYFTEEAAADAATGAEAIAVALSLAGAWSDLDWEETAAALDRIRHESTPTPPVDLDR